MLWVLKRIVSVRRFFEHPKQMLKMIGKTTLRMRVCLDLCISLWVDMFMYEPAHENLVGAQWLSGRVLDSRPRAAGLSLACVTVLWSLSLRVSCQTMSVLSKSSPDIMRTNR